MLGFRDNFVKLLAHAVNVCAIKINYYYYKTIIKTVY